MNKTIHRIPRIWQFLYWFFVLFFAFGIVDVIWIVLDDRFKYGRDDMWPHLIFIAVGSILAILLFKASSGVTMVTSPNGLEYHGVGLHMRSSWENMEKIKLVGPIAHLGFGAEVIVLTTPPEILSVSWYRKLLISFHEDIPLLEFGQWRYSALGIEIKKYAPKLLG